MKSLNKLIFGIVAVLATIVGCERSNIYETELINNNQGGDFRIIATTPSNDTKVNIDGLSVSWNESDFIRIEEIDEDGKFGDLYTFYVDEESISENGKYAEFKGFNLTAGKQYIAFYYQGTNYGSSNNTNIAYSYYISDYDVDNIDIIMQSNKFEYDGESLPQIYFEHQSALLELNIQLSSISEYVGEVKSIKISSDSNESIFLYLVTINSLGERVYSFDSSNIQQYASNSIDITLAESIKFSISEPISIMVPLTWNGYLAAPEGEFVFTIYTSDDKESSVTKPMQILEEGVRYNAELVFDQPEDMIGNDRAALVELYNATGGDSWTENDNWCTDAPLSEWAQVRVNSNSGRVTSLSLSSNNLSGSIPESIGNLASLEYLYLNSNNLSGSIPESIGNLANLEYLRLDFNNLSGSIPESIGNLANLEDLNLVSNDLSGSIPESIGNLVNLETLHLSGNNLSGSIPESIGNLANLESLGLYFNNFSGSIPESIGNLANLEYLYLNSNNLSGSIPESIGNLENLDVLYLSYNNLSGSIPESIGNLTNLTALYLGYNELSGVIPESFGNLVNLKTVYLYYNYLIGPLPEAFSDNSTIAQNATTWVLTPQYSGYGFDVTEIPYVYVSPSVFSVFSSYYSYATISIETDRSWSVSSSEDWLIFDVYSGTNSYDLGFTIKANETYEERSATVKLYFEGVTKSISITQEAKIDVGIPDFGDAEL